MFLEQLQNTNQKESFMKLAYWVATADGSLGLPEIKMLDIFEQEMGVQALRHTAGVPSIPQACSAFPDELSRKITFSNLLALSCSDEFENQDQTHAMEKIREGLSISQSDAKDYRDWMKIIKGSYFPRYYVD